MRTLTANEQALYDVRLGVLRDWAREIERDPQTIRLHKLALLDERAEMVLRYVADTYKAFLVEPTGDVPHHALNNTTWGFFRTAMRFTPAVLYDKIGGDLVTHYDDTLANPQYREGWHYPSIATGGAVSLVRATNTEVPEQYFNLGDDKVAVFLDAAGGNVIRENAIPDPYPTLVFDDITLGQLAGSVIRHSLEAIGGKPSLTYTLVSAVGSLTTTIAGSTLIIVTAGATPGDYAGKIKVTDALGASVEATVTLTIWAPTP